MPRRKALPNTLAVAHRLQDQLNDALAELIRQSEQVTRIADKMKEFKKILEEHDERHHLKNRHQIGKLCNTCNRVIDPRGWSKHSLKHEREGRLRLSA